MKTVWLVYIKADSNARWSAHLPIAELGVKPHNGICDLADPGTRELSLARAAPSAPTPAPATPPATPHPLPAQIAAGSPRPGSTAVSQSITLARPRAHAGPAHRTGALPPPSPPPPPATARVSSLKGR